MKVLVMFPDQLKTRKGGLRTQVERTVEELEKLGVDVVCFNSSAEYDFTDFDLVHIFSMNTPTYFKCLLVRGSLPIVYSSVMWRTSPSFLIRVLLECTLKVPFMVLNDTISCRKLSEWSARILPNTNAEKEWLSSAIGVDKEKCFVVPNAADDYFKDITTATLEEQSGLVVDGDFVLCVSVVSTRKNLLRLAKACINCNFKLVLVGPVVDASVADEINVMIKSGAQITMLGMLENNSYEMGWLLRQCRVFCLPSYYETPGIAALEAGLCGANIAITEVGGTREYFEEHAIYLDPNKQSSVDDALRKAWSRSWNEDDKRAVASHVRNNFTWNVVAKKTLSSYEAVIGN